MYVGLMAMTSHLPLVYSTTCIQKSWDATIASTAVESLLENAPDDLARACLLATSSKESGAWLHALPISSLGFRMDDNTIRVTVDLCLGSTLCRPHSCQHCGAEVDHVATHSLSCRKSEGHHYRHTAVNDILYRTLGSAHIPSGLEPSDLNHSDGKQSEGITMIPWKNRKLLVWDVACSDTLTPSYHCHAASSTGAVANLAEERKSSKYSSLAPSHSFTPVAIESKGPIGRKSLGFLMELSQRVQQRTDEVRARAYLLQHLSVAVQRGNAICVAGSVGYFSDLDPFYV